MGLISATTILTSLCLFHITLGYFFITSPGSVADQAMVWVLGEAMGLPHVRSFEAQSPSLAFLGIILGFFGIADLVTLSRDEYDVNEHWSIQSPLRFTLSFTLTLYTFFFSASSPFYTPSDSSPFSPPRHHPSNPSYIPSGWGGDALKNRVFFTFMFVETISWLWVWVTLQEERRDVLARRATRQARRRSSSHH